MQLVHLLVLVGDFMGFALKFVQRNEMDIPGC